MVRVSWLSSWQASAPVTPFHRQHHVLLPLCYDDMFLYRKRRKQRPSWKKPMMPSRLLDGHHRRVVTKNSRPTTPLSDKLIWVSNKTWASVSMNSWIQPKWSTSNETCIIYDWSLPPWRVWLSPRSGRSLDNGQMRWRRWRRRSRVTTNEYCQKGSRLDNWTTIRLSRMAQKCISGASHSQFCPVVCHGHQSGITLWWIQLVYQLSNVRWCLCVLLLL